MDSSHPPCADGDRPINIAKNRQEEIRKGTHFARKDLCRCETIASDSTLIIPLSGHHQNSSRLIISSYLIQRDENTIPTTQPFQIHRNPAT